MNGIYPELETLYLDLHSSPKLAMHEQQTALTAQRERSIMYGLREPCQDVFFKQPTSLLQGLARHIAPFQHQHVENQQCQVRS